METIITIDENYNVISVEFVRDGETLGKVTINQENGES